MSVKSTSFSGQNSGSLGLPTNSPGLPSWGPGPLRSEESLVAEIPMRTRKQLGPLESMIHSDEDGPLDGARLVGGDWNMFYFSIQLGKVVAQARSLISNLSGWRHKPAALPCSCALACAAAGLSFCTF